MNITDFTNQQDYAETVTLLTCLDCETGFEKLIARGLCSTCYKRNQRHGTLQDYPTTEFWTNRENHIKWAVKYYRDELIAELGI